MRWLDEHEELLDEDVRARRHTSPLRVFDNLEAKPAAVRRALSEAPTIGESLCDACREHFAAVLGYLDSYGVAYELVPTLVRGLDYYTRTTWEFVGPAQGAQSTISGGGRYDGLVEEIGGRPTPGVGFGAGIERLVLALEEAGVTAAPEPPELLVLLDEGADRRAALVELAKLRAAGVACDTEYAGRSLKGQFTQLSRSGARGYVLVKADGAVLKRTRESPEEAIGVQEIAARYLG